MSHHVLVTFLSVLHRPNMPHEALQSRRHMATQKILHTKTTMHFGVLERGGVGFREKAVFVNGRRVIMTPIMTPANTGSEVAVAGQHPNPFHPQAKLGRASRSGIIGGNGDKFGRPPNAPHVIDTVT